MLSLSKILLIVLVVAAVFYAWKLLRPKAAGRPVQSCPFGICFPGVSMAPAASIAPVSSRHPSMTIAPMPTKALS